MSTDDMRKLSAIIDTIYQGATHTDAWAKVVPQVADWIGANQAILFTLFTTPQRGGLVVPHGITQAALEAWSGGKHTSDIWSNRSAERGLLVEGNIVLGQELATDDELRASAWYTEFLHDQNIARLMSGLVFGVESPERTCTALSLYRSWADPAFDTGTKARLALLMPHLSRSLGLMMALRGTEMRLTCTEAALNRLKVGVVLIGSDESVIFANQAAEQVFRHADGLGLNDVTGAGKRRLKLWHEASREAVRLALRAALDRHLQVNHFNQKIHVMRPSGQTPYALQVSACTDAWSARAELGTPCAVLLIVDPEQRLRIDAALLAELYRLTATETRVAVALLDDDKPESLAATLQMQPSTLKTHMGKLYDKFGVNSRSGLVKVLLSHAEP